MTITKPALHKHPELIDEWLHGIPDFQVDGILMVFARHDDILDEALKMWVEKNLATTCAMRPGVMTCVTLTAYAWQSALIVARRHMLYKTLWYIYTNRHELKTKCTLFEQLTDVDLTTPLLNATIFEEHERCQICETRVGRPNIIPCEDDDSLILCDVCMEDYKNAMKMRQYLAPST